MILSYDKFYMYFICILQKESDCYLVLNFDLNAFILLSD